MNIAAQISLTREEMEQRRLEAAQDLLNGLSQSKVARKYSVSRTTASRWYRALSSNGVDSLKRRKATGRPSRLTAAQLARVSEIYRERAIAYGFADDQWTTARMAAVIESQFGVHYDRDHVGRLLYKLGLRERRPKMRHATATPYVASRYSPNTDLSRPEISPSVA
ncbi:MAG TPA: helix-turn-helix domain-containing protein [Bryobacteraceae bacterium]|nr:helix-turn-helix domain-containing protein [Bryobacteraceae bacterium]